MSSVQNPEDKKRLSYERDHYNRNGENNKSWRKVKPLKKRKAVRRFRKASNDLLKMTGSDRGSLSAERKLGSIRKDRVYDWGSVHLQQFVADRKETRKKRVGSKVRRKQKPTRSSTAQRH